MCGRFTNRLTWREIVALYRLSVPAMPDLNLPARYNICPHPTQFTRVVERENLREGIAAPSHFLLGLVCTAKQATSGYQKCPLIVMGHGDKLFTMSGN